MLSMCLTPYFTVQLSDPDQLYRDDERIDFLEGVGTALVRAGWSLDLPNAKGRTPRRLLQLSHHIAEVRRPGVWPRGAGSVAGGRCVAGDQRSDWRLRPHALCSLPCPPVHSAARCAGRA